MEKNKYTLISIIILLLIFIPATIVGMKEHFKEENPNHEVYFDNKIYFYDNSELIAKYTCKTKGCHFAKAKNMSGEEDVPTSLILKKYAFITDSNKISLIDVKNGTVILNPEEIKTYEKGIENDSYVIKVNNKFGVISFKPTLKVYLKTDYDDIYFTSSFDISAKLSDIVTYKDNKYNIYDKDMNVKFSSETYIAYKTDNYVIVKNEFDQYFIQDYNNYLLVNLSNITEYKVYGDYLVIKQDDNNILLKENNTTTSKFDTIKSYSSDVQFALNDNTLTVKLNDEIIDSYDL